MARKEIKWSGRGHYYSEEEIQLVTEVMQTADPLTQGKYKDQFEAKFREYLDVKHAFAVANCTNALDLAAIFSRVGRGDEVIIPAHTFCATAIPFARTGARIIWADIDPDTRVITPETLKLVISSRTKVIVAVHLYGLPAPMPEIMSLAQENNILVVEDCAQCIGAEIGGRKAGSFGDFSCFSFHGAKNMSTLGEGGMIVVRSEDDAKLVPGLRHNGLCAFPDDRKEYWKPAMSNVDVDIQGIWPYNFCLSEAQCALGEKMLDRVDRMAEKRIRRAEKLIKSLRDFQEVVFQKVPQNYKHVYHLLAARYDGSAYGCDRDDFISNMWGKYGVKIIVQYYPLYRYPLFQTHGLGENDCINTDYFYDNMVSFPFHEWMSEEDFSYMIEATIRTLEVLRK